MMLDCASQQPYIHTHTYIYYTYIYTEKKLYVRERMRGKINKPIFDICFYNDLTSNHPTPMQHVTQRMKQNLKTKTSEKELENEQKDCQNEEEEQKKKTDCWSVNLQKPESENASRIAY